MLTTHRTLVLFLIIFLMACGHPAVINDLPSGDNSSSNDTATAILDQPDKIAQYQKDNPDNAQPSESKGTASKGSLVNGKLVPFSGKNFMYFDTTSYINRRAYLNGKAREAVLNTYEALEKEMPGRLFRIMECSNKEGGKIAPHHTHQNGLSVDLMSPLLKDGKPYYDLDGMGATHYLMEFDSEGKYTNDKSVTIDFDLVAKHLLLLKEQAALKGLKISKVILKLELKDELFATEHGKKLKQSGIYFAQNLTPLINSLHDDHYHVDFEPL